MRWAPCASCALLALLALLVMSAPVAGARPEVDEDAADRAGAGDTAGSDRFGITFVTDEEERTKPGLFLPRPEGGDRPVVILVHGLDDPGWMWRDVITVLRREGFTVGRMQYPNDGPIADSADLFARSLQELRRAGVDRLSIVAHSMGGLVTRDVLTRRAHYAGDARGGERFPAVERFIMCGTPNHGSELARLRAISEIKEQVTRTFAGSGDWLGGLSDGNGEAAVDLLPGSVFLERLNGRPLATGVRYTIIAGRASPVAEDDLKELSRTVRKTARRLSAPRWMRTWIGAADRQAKDLLKQAVRGLGDGCVSIDSARLSGVDDFVIVEADHVGMIVRVVRRGPEPPVGIPIILERLKAEVREDETEAGRQGSSGGTGRP
jgi:pimeloyl-ACP methyl ester carboxylesterase